MSSGSATTAGGIDPASHQQDPVAWSRAEIDKHCDTYLAALARQLREDSTAFGLLSTAERAGADLADTFAALASRGPIALGALTDSSPDERVDTFLARFVASVVGEGGLVADAAARRAALRCAEELLARRPELERSIRSGQPGDWTVLKELFCFLYRIFFADTVKELMTAVIAGKLALAFPAIAVLDPVGDIAYRIAEKISEHIPTPCDNPGSSKSDRSMFAAGRAMASSALPRALELAMGGV